MSFFKKTDEFEDIEDQENVNLLEKKPWETQQNNSFTQKHEPSILYHDVIINGDIFSESSLTVFGEVNGNIDCKEDLRLESNITANVKGGSVLINSAKVKGKVESKSELVIDNESEIEGDVTAGSCSVDGKITGNLSVRGALDIHKNAVIKGDIETREISVSQGSQLDVRITMTNK